MLTLLIALTACNQPPSLPSPEPPPTEVEPGTRMEVRERIPLWRSNSGPPPPEAGITGGQCNDMLDGGPVNGPDCVTDTLECGQTIVGHTRGGVDRFSTAFWEQKFCWPATEDHDGGDERVYRLMMPEGRVKATITLDTPCADLDLMAFPWQGETCPTLSQRITKCESMRKAGTRREQIQAVSSNGSPWLLVVEGIGDEEGAFSLTVQCGDWY